MKITFAAFALLVLSGSAGAAEPLRVITDRTESHLKPLFEIFEKKTGTKVSAVFVDQGLVERIASQPLEADVVITKDAELLEIARERGLLQSFSSKAITDAIPARFRDEKNFYFVDAYRARLIIYSKKRVKLSEVSTYESLASPAFKNRLCIRSGYHDYNVSLFGQMIAATGLEKTRALLKGLHDNLAREPKGGDRDQAKGIFEGKCDVAVMNSYYFPLMMGNPEQKAWAESIGSVFPNQETDGTYIMRSALGLTKASARTKQATALLEFFASFEGQSIISNLTYQYMANETVPRHRALASLGAGQVTDGKFTKINFVALPEIAKHREAVVKLLNETNFDKR